MATPLQGISSMATRQVLAELVAAYAQQSADPVHIESLGGVDAARRVQAGEAFDVVILASDAIDKLAAQKKAARAGKPGCVVCGQKSVVGRASALTQQISCLQFFCHAQGRGGGRINNAHLWPNHVLQGLLQ